MLNSRKLHYALALGGMLVMGAASSFAQTNCSVTSTPLAVRPEGLAEQVGDINLHCTGTPGTIPPDAAILVTLNAPVANTSGTTGVNATATAGTGVVTGVLNSAIPNSISFNFDATHVPTGSDLVISGIRIDATKLAPNSSVSATLVVTSGNTVLSLNPNPTTVGFVLPSSFVFSVVWGATSGVPDATKTGSAQSLAACVTSNSVQAFLRFTELFSGVLRTIAHEGANANTATQVRFVLSGIALGTDVHVYVPNSLFTTGGNGLTPGTGISTTAVDPSTISGTYIPNGTDTAYAGGYGEVTGEFVYTITGDNLSTVDSLTIPVIVKYTGGTSSLPFGDAFVGASLAPNGSDKFPRFVNTGPTVRLFTLAACSTSLLFPYVTNVTGFDTGVAIMNTTQDPPTPGGFGTTGQSGTCTLSFFGRNVEDATAPLPSPVTTASIPAGNLFAWSLANGGGAAPLSRTGFQGYIIAQCNFQLAHGYAFISDLGAKTLAHGYLALVITTSPGTSRAVGNATESLNH